MNKEEMRNTFDKFQKVAVKDFNGDIALVGKYCSVEWVENTWDVYLHDTVNALKGDFTGTISQTRVNRVLNKLPEWVYSKNLDGEGWFQTTNLDWLKDFLFENRKLLGLLSRRPPPKVSIQDRMRGKS